MSYGVVIPVGTPHLPTILDRLIPTILYFTERAVPVVLVINGGMPDYKTREALLGSVPSSYLQVMHRPKLNNPYQARNEALFHLFRVVMVDAAFLTDADCMVDPSVQITLHANLCAVLPTDPLIAGEVCTDVPATSKHFCHLQGFECYKGYTLKNSAVGASMVIPRRVYDLLGPMADDTPSGGDAEYAVRWLARGEPIRTDPRLLMRKRIDTLTLKGIVEKQLRRGAQASPYFVPTETVLLQRMRQCLLSQLAALDLALADGGFDAGSYPQFIDPLFGYVFNLGLLSQEYDA